MTVLQWVNRVRRKLKQKPVTSLTDTSGHWPVSELLDILNDRMDLLCEEAKCLRGTSVQSAVEDQREYDYESDWVDILGVWYDNAPLIGFGTASLDFMEKYQGLETPWRESTSTEPYGWYESETTGKYGLIEAPSADDADAITIYHTINPTQFTTASTATDELLNGHGHLRPYHPALVYFGVAEAELEDGNEEKARHFEAKGAKLVNKLMRKIKYPKNTLPSMLDMTGNRMQGVRRFWTK